MLKIKTKKVYIVFEDDPSSLKKNLEFLDKKEAEEHVRNDDLEQTLEVVRNSFNTMDNLNYRYFLHAIELKANYLAYERGKF